MHAGLWTGTDDTDKTWTHHKQLLDLGYQGPGTQSEKPVCGENNMLTMEELYCMQNAECLLFAHHLSHWPFGLRRLTQNTVTRGQKQMPAKRTTLTW